MKKTITIGENEFVFDRDGDQVSIVARQSGVAIIAIGIQMTKAQASTLGDAFKALAR